MPLDLDDNSNWFEIVNEVDKDGDGMVRIY